MNKKFLYFIPALISIFIIYSVINALSFHVTNVDPKNGEMPLVQDYVEFSTNYEIKNLDKNAIRANVDIKSVEYSKKNISIYLTKTLDKNQTLDLVIPKIESVNHKFLTIKKTFIGKYVPVSNMTEAAKARELANQDTKSKKYPLTNLLPYISKYFQITYKMPNPVIGQTKPIIIVTSLEIPANNPTAAIGSPDWINALSHSRTLAIDWLNSNGYKSNLYQLGFSENYLVDQFKGVYVNNQ